MRLCFALVMMPFLRAGCVSVSDGPSTAFLVAAGDGPASAAAPAPDPEYTTTSRDGIWRARLGEDLIPGLEREDAVGVIAHPGSGRFIVLEGDWENPDPLDAM